LKTEVLARSAFSVALCIAFLILFRGSMSLLNAILIPTILFVSANKTPKAPVLTSYFVLIVVTFFFFLPQLFFVIFYCLVAGFLVIERNRLNRKVIALSLSLASFLAFIFIVKLTDHFFGVGLELLYLRISNGNQVFYYLVLLALGLITGLGTTVFSGLINRRVFHR